MLIKNTQQDIQLNLNYPQISLLVTSYDEYCSLDIKATCGDLFKRVDLFTYKEKPTEIINLRGTLIKTELNESHQEIINLLNRKIENKMVFIDPYGFCEILPNDPSQYYVYSPDELESAGVSQVDGVWCFDKDVKNNLIPVQTEGEADVNELFQNNFRYLYDYTQDIYKKCDEATAKIKFFKGALRNHISLFYGDFNDRIADYSRLIYFLFKKCETLLSDDEKQFFSDILNNTPKPDELKKILYIEKLILDTVRVAKKGTK